MNINYRKRKLVTDHEQFSSLPTWKHQCRNRSRLPSNGDDLAEGKTTGVGAETKSMMPEQTGTETKSDNGTRSHDSLNAMMVAATYEESVYNDGDVEALENYYDDDALLEFNSQPRGDDHLYSNMEQDQDQNHEENPCAANAILYTFSSGTSWKFTEEGQATERKPTIDKEFEEYFSNLLL